MNPAPLPIDSALPGLIEAAGKGPVLLGSPPGTGKTTRVPPALESLSPGQVVVLEPRRLAARAAARRVAAELGSALGDMVGYQVRHDRRVSAGTRIRFVTEGVLIRQLLSDPFLEGVGTVVLDEFHERHLEGDLALAMVQEVRETVRPELRLVVMSATLDPEPLAEFLGDCTDLEVKGAVHPVLTVYADRDRRRSLDQQVGDTVVRALGETEGDVLVFLPGRREIRTAQELLERRRPDALVLPLHGGLEADEQDFAIQTQERRKVILATNVAESSVTVEGVTAVVDSGLVRTLRHDRGRGLDTLTVEKISRASADQRRGRAGRTGAGICYRLWVREEHRHLVAQNTPEIRRLDLTGPILQVCAFTAGRVDRFRWFEAPDPAATKRAAELLELLGAVEPVGGGLTSVGRELLGLPLQPRLARMVVEGRRSRCRGAAATAAALLEEPPGRMEQDSLVEACQGFLEAERRGFGEGDCRALGLSRSRARALARNRDQLASLASPAARPDNWSEESLARAILAGFPDRVARRVSPGSREAVMVGGRGLLLPSGAEAGPELVVAVQLMDRSGRRTQVNMTAPVERDWLEEVFPGSVATCQEADLDAAAGRVVGIRRLRYRDLILEESRGAGVAPEDSSRLLGELLARDPWPWLGAQKELHRFLARVAWLREAAPEQGLPPLGTEEVATEAAALLGARVTLACLRDAPLLPRLAAHLAGEGRAALERHAPDRVLLPSGRRATVDYGAEAGPTIAGRVQEFFGCTALSPLGRGRIPLLVELQGPNGRPVQVTRDLQSFWKNVYPQVRRELQRRYPRHSWPEDPCRARPEARPQRRRKS